MSSDHRTIDGEEAILWEARDHEEEKLREEGWEKTPSGHWVHPEATRKEDVDAMLAHNLKRILEARLPSATEAFMKKAEDEWLPGALDWNAEAVRRAQGFDAFTDNARQAVAAFDEGESPLEVVFDMLMTDLKQARKRLMSGKHHEPHNMEAAYGEGVGSAFEALRDALSLVEEQVDADLTGGR